MGRDAGWLTAASVLARNSYSRAPHLIYLPEHPFSKEQFIEDIKAQFKQREHIVIAVSEDFRMLMGITSVQKQLQWMLLVMPH